MPYSKLNFKILDAAGKASNVSFTGREITGANYVAQQQLQSDLAAALADLTEGLVKKQSRVAYEVEFAGNKSSSQVARRELKWLLRFHYEGTTKNGWAEIPCPVLTLTQLDSADLADMTQAEWTAFVAAFEAYEAYTDEAGTVHAAVIDSVEIAGRNL